MSVDFHEAVSFDSTRYRVDWEDDFEGDSLKDHWTLTVAGGGTGAVVDGVDGGVSRLSTPTASDVATLWWNSYRSLHVNKKVTIEAYVRANGGVTDTSRLLCVLVYDASNRIMIYHATDGVDILLYCRNNGAITSVDSGVNLDDQFHVYRIETSPTAVRFYIDDVLVGTITTNIPSDAGDYLQPQIYIVTNADTDPATSMDIDYVYIRQNRT